MNISLTAGLTRTIINSPFPHESAVIGVTESHGISRNHAVFLCVKYQSFVMSGWIEQSKDWLGRVSSTPILSKLGSIIGVMQSCFNIKHTEAIMPKSHTTKPSNRNTQSLRSSQKTQSRFNVLTKSGRSIARKIPFSIAIRLKNNQPELSIKFDSMVGML